MNYRLHRQGVDLGVFPLEELRRRRQAGELAGDEYVLADGAPAWEILDSVLQRAKPPPLTSAASTGKSNRKWIWIVLSIGGGLALVVVIAGVVIGVRVVHAVRTGQPIISGMAAPVDPVAAVSKPVPATNVLTEADARELSKKFRTRQWVEGYEQRGQRDQPCDAEALQMLESFIAYNYGSDKTNLLDPVVMCDKLAAESGCDDPLVLAIAGTEATDVHEKIRRLNRALTGFDQSHHRAYPKFYAAVLLAAEWSNNPQKRAAADAKALAAFQQMFKDGSVLPEDQSLVGEILINDWGYQFFDRNRKTLPTLLPPGKSFEWLREVLEGESHIIEAWRLRGGGYVNTVTPQGWQGFQKEMGLARCCYTKACELQPRLPLAPCRMIYVCLSDSSGLGEMRQWFDRTTAIQIDYPRAWSDMRWGLRPRWYGNEEAMLAFGATAVNTARFDTDVPRKLFDSLSDIESETQLSPGQHIYGRPDVWPLLQQMYEGYIAEPSQSASRDGWRSTYATIAYLAGKYDVSRAQFDALHWKPHENHFTGYGVDLSLLPLEVAARTGPARNEVTRAEDRRAAGDLKSALQIYQDLSRTNADARTGEFIRTRLASLDQEVRLQDGGSVDFLPTGEKDPNWVFKAGVVRASTKDALEIESDADGHFLFSHTRFAVGFEMKGEFEVVQTTARAFQVGLIMGLPEPQGRNWFSFRIRRNETQGDFVTYSRGFIRSTPHPVSLHDGVNSFTFRLEDGKATASVNGVEIFHATDAPTQIAVPEGEFQLGLGAHSEKNETTLVRYRNIQIRRL